MSLDLTNSRVVLNLHRTLDELLATYVMEQGKGSVMKVRAVDLLQWLDGKRLLALATPMTQEDEAKAGIGERKFNVIPVDKGQLELGKKNLGAGYLIHGDTRTCLGCGATLDPLEKCACQDKPQEKDRNNG